MESNATVTSQTPPFSEDLDDRESGKLEDDNPENKHLAEPPSEKPQTSALTGLDPHAFPDGGFQAWFCIAGGFCTVFCSFGWVNCM
jgi:hypothetical protein